MAYLLVVAGFVALFSVSSAIECYQCSAGKSIDCSDVMVHMGALEPQSCDNVFEAQYCVKSTSLDEGIGPKRFCSSVDLGNYCNYVRQPGDILTYRSCVYTCSTDGCNSSSPLVACSVLHFIIFMAAVAICR
ncbi:U-scoloptoxin(05)-Sm1a [Aethina tumida]|uniref:U-scoloptoxin(05)-Sm1a n=1 Tax=Aethina tumida TaxID=116153 RepID=UPI00096B4C1E|nr:U-scoloptoxin(05)-Sm1a [Aethina tumida]XP_049820700.1 U-scoloptoxin(05)-Sm1a [Aethina tumida]